LSSNAAPIMVRFVGVDIAPSVIIKSGDDLRQDEFALLFGDLLNRIWVQEGVAARVVTYRVLSIKDKVGMIEMVPNVKSVGAIQGGVAGAMKKDVLRAHLSATLTGSWNDLMQDFVTTLAGASVFEYILGIGDRHGKKKKKAV
jgi:phosphatidylinositol kinase/protein kinase (PI-3  family)